MKYIKLYENILPLDGESKTGDYVICNDFSIPQTINTIGRIELRLNVNNYPYYIKFDDDFMDSLDGEELSYFQEGLRKMSKDEIIHFSQNREDLETIINSNRYNL